MLLKASNDRPPIALGKKREMYLERISRVKEGHKVSCVNILICW